MLIELKVSNFAIIENIQVNFEKGLNILSGETGAGKSILLKGLGLLMGLKGSTEQIREGCEFAFIEGSFDLTGRRDILERLIEFGIATEDAQLIVRRVLSAEGKSRIYINGSLCTLQQLREIVSPLIEVTGNHTPLIEMTGQHESKHLMSKSYHLDLLDEYVGAWDLRKDYQTAFFNWKKIQKEILELNEKSPQLQKQLDFLKFQKDEIIELDPSPGEDLELENKIKAKKSIGKIFEFHENFENTLQNADDSVLVGFQKILNYGSEFAKSDSKIESSLQLIQQAKTLVEESLYQMSKSKLMRDLNSDDLESLESRLSKIKKILKKYGPTIDDVLANLLKIETEINQIVTIDDILEQLQNEAEKLEETLVKLAENLHVLRAKGATKLEKLVNSELLELNMKGVLFSIQLKRTFHDDPRQLTATGCTDVEFCTQSGAKDTPKALGKVASGGELSRILLSLKKVIGNHRYPRTYLFDEVDTGVSGETAQKVGRKLKAISHGQQILCITHLPQVASFGDVHFLIQKSPVRSSMKMEVNKLNKKERVHEIARLVSGEKITSASLKHAEEMLTEAR